MSGRTERLRRNSAEREIRIPERRDLFRDPSELIPVQYGGKWKGWPFDHLMSKGQVTPKAEGNDDV